MAQVREVERFQARSEDGGYETTIIVLQRMIPAATRMEPAGVTPGLKEAQTIDGRSCNYKGEGRFEIVGTGTVLTRV